MKSAKSIEEQIKLLLQYGVIINDSEKAKEILLDIGYYRLGFYFFPFETTHPSVKNRTHSVVNGTHFEDAVSLYYFDFDLRHILNRYLTRVEIGTLTVLEYILNKISSNRADDYKNQLSELYCNFKSRNSQNVIKILEICSGIKI